MLDAHGPMLQQPSHHTGFPPFQHTCDQCKPSSTAPVSISSPIEAPETPSSSMSDAIFMVLQKHRSHMTCLERPSCPGSVEGSNASNSSSERAFLRSLSRQDVSESGSRDTSRSTSVRSDDGTDDAAAQAVGAMKQRQRDIAARLSACCVVAETQDAPSPTMCLSLAPGQS